MNVENLSPAMVKAIEAGGTNNTILGNALVKREIMVRQEDMSRAIIELRYVLSAEYAASEEKRFADAMEREENETPTSEDFEIENAKRAEETTEILSLLDEYPLADMDRAEEIEKRLRELGVQPPIVIGQSDAVAVNSIVAMDDAEQRFAEAVDADDAVAQAEILNGIVPPVIPVGPQALTDQEREESVREVFGTPVTRDPNATRYEDIPKWTDDRLLSKEDELTRRLRRRTLLGSDRKLSENRLMRIRREIEIRDL